MMPSNIEMKIQGNNLSGTVPPSWAHFSTAKIDLRDNTLITGCAPDGVIVTVSGAHDQLPFCSNSSPEVQALNTLYSVLMNATRGTSEGQQLLASWATGAGNAGEPTHIQYVKCILGTHQQRYSLSPGMIAVRVQATSCMLCLAAVTSTACCWWHQENC
jgi:hypothetical protein